PPEGRIGGDPGAEEWGRRRELEAGRDLDRVPLRDDDLRRVAAVRRRFAVHLGAVVREGRPLLAKLLEVAQARVARVARVYEAPDAGQVSHGELRDAGADLRHAAGDLVARHHREDGAAPLCAALVGTGTFIVASSSS